LFAMQFALISARAISNSRIWMHVYFYLFKVVRDLQTSRSMPLIFTIRTS